MYNGNVHHGAEHPTHVRPVNGILERAPAIVYTRDVIRAYLCTARTTQVLLRRRALERVHAFDEFEFDRRAIMFGPASRARPPWSVPLAAAAAGAGKQILVATKIEIPQGVAVATGDPVQAQRRTRVAKRGPLAERSDANELQGVAREQPDFVLGGLCKREHRTCELCQLYGRFGEGEM